MTNNQNENHHVVRVTQFKECKRLCSFGDTHVWKYLFLWDDTKYICVDQHKHFWNKWGQINLIFFLRYRMVTAQSIKRYFLIFFLRNKLLCQYNLYVRVRYGTTILCTGTFLIYIHTYYLKVSNFRNLPAKSPKREGQLTTGRTTTGFTTGQVEICTLS